MSSRQLEGGRGWDIYRLGPKAPVGFNDPVLNFVQLHRVKAPTGALDPSSWQLPRFITIGTGYYHQPVPISPPSFGTGWWFKPVPMLTHWNRLEPPPGANCPPLGRSKAKGTSCCCILILFLVTQIAQATMPKVKNFRSWLGQARGSTLSQPKISLKHVQTNFAEMH